MAPLPAGRACLALLKASAAPGKASLVLPIGKPVIAYLRPIPTAPGCLDARDVALLSDWRNRFVKSFLTEFVAHPARTAAWLAGPVHGNDGKILFMVESLDGTPLGHIGLAFIDWTSGYGEADAIVRGGDAPPGLMKLALQTTLKWARDQLGLISLGVRVRSDNTALEFYRKVGFTETKRVPLAREEHGGDVTWSESAGLAGAEASLVYMLYQES
ncbi:aminotransferase [Massilia eurypsychrophila]|uniref:Aminotransferase n=1 Tax=Massilia eurypsychrophila TaxID=1485217 RepID=A0A2G8TBN7_9BURK|nr:GNAT family protein [Massilia eurypsychrophila]PIL43393.1 aminotransferase [Massilia eurypsychrophila]